ncbi:MAG: ferrochelatase [Planctomycetes bacterium]|nr:ferrochelatase [Planctomycetota bacterium]
MEYLGEPNFRHDSSPAVGVMITNLGTPDAPTKEALKRYLREFLSDPRVIELPRWKWKIILECFVLTTRPAKSAHAYEKVWSEGGSPLLVTSKAQRSGVEERLRRRFGGPIHVALGMRYGSPSIDAALQELLDHGCRRVLVMPLYPQYSASTTASTLDALFASLERRRWVPELRTVHQYHDHPGYIGALASSVRERWSDGGEPERLLLSFHGLPERYFRSGDPYHCHCHKTGRLLAEALGLADDRYRVTFQSRFGREPWLQPYTDETLKAWGKDGVASVDVICPGFSADCLETIEEIDMQNREIFEGAGGGRFRYIPCLNERGDHLDLLAEIASDQLRGWTVPPDQYDEAAVRRALEDTRRRADAMRVRTASDPS